MGDKIDPRAEKPCPEAGMWQSIKETLHLTDKSCNASVEAMKPVNPKTEKELPNLLIDGIEAVKRSGRTGTSNVNEAEMLKDI